MNSFHAIIEYGMPAFALAVINDFDRQAEKKRADSAAVRLHSAMMAEFTTQAKLLGFAPTPIISNYSGVRLNLFVRVPGFLSDVSQPLCSLLEYLSNYYIDEPTSSDNPNAGQRTYDFNDGDSGLSVSIIAELDENSDACQRIITGTERRQRIAYVDVDEPVYAFKC